MAKSKSSASSATRKKHARKAAVAHGVVEEPSLPKEKKAKGKDKKKNKEPQKKVYIPPKLPPDLLVVLRRFSKKDSITKRRALEEFQSAWVDQARREGEDGSLLPILEETLPVWLHHSPALFIHPSRRIRLLAVGLHASLLRIPSLRDKVFFHIREVATTDQAEFIIGTWCMAAHDADRQVSSYARESWSNFVSLSSDSSKMLILDEGLLSQLWEFIQRALLDSAEYPNAWILDASSEEEAEEDEESDLDESNEEAPKTTKLKESISTAKPSYAYEEFLQFLALGCSGSPVQGYPAMLVVLSTIPSSILAPSSSTSPLADLFTSFWAAIDARVLNSLDRAAASQAFLSSLLECVVFLVRRLLNSSDEDVELLTSGGGAVRKVETAQILVKEQIGRAWEELSARHLKLEEAIIGTLLARTLFSLHQLHAGLFDAAWNVLATNIRSQVVTMEGNISTLVPTVLKAFSNQFEKDTVPAVASSALIREVVQSALEHCENILKSEEGTTPERVSSLVGILDTFGDFLFQSPELAARIDDTLQDHAYRLLLSMPSLVFVYLSYRHDEQRSLQLWHKLLSAIASHPEEADTTIPPLLDAAERGMLPRYLEPRGDELEGLAGGLLSEALSSSSTSSQLSLVRRILHAPDHFISRSCFHGLVDSLSAAFNLHFENVLHEEAAPIVVFESPLDLIRSLVDNHALIPLPDKVSVSLLPDIFLFAYLLPRFREIDAAEEILARGLCDSWLLCASDEVKQNALAIVKQRLRELIVDCSSVPTPEHILRMLAGPCPSLEVDVMVDIFPDRAELDVMLEHLPSVPQDASLAVVDPLAPPHHYTGQNAFPNKTKGNIWALRHILALSLYADELLQIPSIQSPIFADHVTKADLQELIAKVQQLTTYLLTSTSQEGWHPSVVSVALEQQANVDLDGAGKLVIDLITRAKQDDNVRESRVLYMILQHAFSAVTKAEADQWMLIARKMEKIAPSASLAIVQAVTRYAPEPPRLDRYRNELAANMLGVPPSKANTEGMWLLRRLAATAPDPDSDVVFLPQLRAVNLVKACQQWITSDEDLDEDVQSEMTLVFLHLVPILQNIPGAHWDLIFDVVENNLENSSFEDASTLVLLSRTLRLFIAIQELALTNKSLRAIWQDRRAADLSLIRDLVGAKLIDVERMSVPLSICRELALQIVQDLPNDLISEDTLPKMCHLLLESSVDVQRMAYQLLHEAAKKYTEHLVLEAAVDSEGTMKSELPPELIDILQRSLNHEDGIEESGQDWFGYLLAWMVTFDLFTDASLKVKSGYTDQLRDLGLITSQFLPSILNILGLYGGTVKAFKLDIWAIDQFYLDFYSPDSSMSLQLLAAHLYYRALLLVPSLIRNWLLDCRDRQLSHAVTSYTSSHFSPAIVKAELAQVKSAGASEDLSDEHLTIKVASAVNEITASYTVDENQLELTLKLPSDWPLHSIEIIDTKRVGVADERWRAWVLGVQQILSFKSGRIIDGLSFWKKNVASYFEGVAECAICYSVINVTDNSLPRKPCKTCKNRFHASCLYKVGFDRIRYCSDELNSRMISGSKQAILQVVRSAAQKSYRDVSQVNPKVYRSLSPSLRMSSNIFTRIRQFWYSY
ncbi:E3 ubiquitin-protein ligase listerin [Grifola frondosa]|uniref:E3 ubiquitin-protein ligase listerin n=1 Tax=Grifola frondosa TaxID=5627 RepID=A0A1C7MKZ5_GRIFR|nr:E3 ubiquitin-protein ligase listerin [Grifola frondosa]